jgi:hypothetical protein
MLWASTACYRDSFIYNLKVVVFQVVTLRSFVEDVDILVVIQCSCMRGADSEVVEDHASSRRSDNF